LFLSFWGVFEIGIPVQALFIETKKVLGFIRDDSTFLLGCLDVPAEICQQVLG
jgi:hypothetical protein